MYLTAVIDNNTLANLTRLKDYHIFSLLRNLFRQIHIPQQVRKEYAVQISKEPDRVWVLERLRPNEGFYSACDRYDVVSLTVVKGLKGIDAGEAEAVAQHIKVNSSYILSDDHRFRKAILSFDPRIKVLSTLHIIAMLDISQSIVNIDGVIKSLYAVHSFSSNNLRKAYMDSANELGIPVSKKTLNAKCSFKRLGLV